MKHLWIIASLGMLMMSCSSDQPLPAPTPAEVGAPGAVTLTNAMEQRAQVQVGAVTRQTLEEKVTYSAVIQPAKTLAGTVSSLVGGVITEMLADIGEPVHKGQGVARLSTTELAPFQERLWNAQAQSQSEQAKILLIKSQQRIAEQEVARRKYLVEQGAGTLFDQQRAEAELASIGVELANAQVLLAQAKTQTQAAKNQLTALGATGSSSSTLILTSPIDGVVVKRDIEPGKVVSMGQPLFSIADLRKVWVVLNVPQTQASMLPQGTPIQFTSEAVPGRVFQGVITGRDEDFDPQMRSIGIRATVANPDQVLKPGLAVLVTAKTPSLPRLVVPTTALQKVEGQEAVFVAQGDQFQLRPVTVGVRTPDWTEVITGVQAGEPIVTQGAYALKGELLKANLGGE